jgi:hypothetical protein
MYLTEAEDFIKVTVKYGSQEPKTLQVTAY